jgi:hypothetical protein
MVLPSIRVYSVPSAFDILLLKTSDKKTYGPFAPTPVKVDVQECLQITYVDIILLQMRLHQFLRHTRPRTWKGRLKIRR